MPSLVDLSDVDKLDFKGNEEPEEEDVKDVEFDEDVLNTLTSAQKDELLKNTDDVRRAIEKVCLRIFNISNSH